MEPTYDPEPSHRHDNRSGFPGLRAYCSRNPRFLSLSARPWVVNAEHECVRVPGATIDCTPTRPPLRLAGPVCDERRSSSLRELQLVRPVSLRTLREATVSRQEC